MSSVDFYYDYISPASYLAWTQLPGICQQYDAEIRYRPIFLGGLFSLVGNESPARIPAKWAWMLDDLKRYAAYYQVPFQHNPHFIFSTLSVMRGAHWALSEGVIETYNRAIFDAVWVQQKDLSDLQVMQRVVAAAGLDEIAVMDAIQQSGIKQALLDETSAAAETGVFGVPTMCVEQQLHFGQDRLMWVEKALSGEG